MASDAGGWYSFLLGDDVVNTPPQHDDSKALLLPRVNYANNAEDSLEPISDWLTGQSAQSSPMTLTPPAFRSSSPSLLITSPLPITSTTTASATAFFLSPPRFTMCLSPLQLSSATSSPWASFLGICRSSSQNKEEQSSPGNYTLPSLLSPPRDGRATILLRPPPTQQKQGSMWCGQNDEDEEEEDEEGEGEEKVGEEENSGGVRMRKSTRARKATVKKTALAKRLFDGEYVEDEDKSDGREWEGGREGGAVMLLSSSSPSSSFSSASSSFAFHSSQPRTISAVTTHRSLSNNSTTRNGILPISSATKALCFGSASLPAAKSILLDKVLRGCITNFIVGPRPPRKWMERVATRIGVTLKQVDSKCSNIRQRSLDRRGRPLPLARDTSSLVDEAMAAALVAEMRAELRGLTEQETTDQFLASDGSGGGGFGGAAAGVGGDGNLEREGAASPIHLTRSSGGKGGRKGGSACTTVAASSTTRRSQGGRERGREEEKEGMTPLRSIGWDLIGAGGREGGKATLTSATPTMVGNRVGTRNKTSIYGSSSSSSSSSAISTTTMIDANNKRKRKPPLLTSSPSTAAATAAAIKAGREGGQWSVPTPAQLRQVAEETGLGLQEVLTVWKKLQGVIRGSL
ncbi:Hypothetical protein NocV09_00801120 [Nannochloropsis oceanica]